MGVHFTRMINGDIECGPNAVFTFKREGYSKIAFSFKDTLQALSFSGTWKLFINHWKFGLNEYKRAFSKSLFLKELQKMIPSLKMNDIIEGRSGVRAMALSKDGNVIDDFKIVKTNNNIHVLNAPSPAATAVVPALVSPSTIFSSVAVDDTAVPASLSVATSSASVTSVTAAPDPAPSANIIFFDPS